MILNEDVVGRIVQYSGEMNALVALRKYMNPVLADSFNFIKYKKLIYGEVQSGKTSKIIEELKKNINNGLQSILVIQNSLLVQQQYFTRLSESGVPFQLIENTTKSIDKPVIVLMNNKYRTKKLFEVGVPANYCIILDESDITHKHVLVENACIEIHVTATPFINKYVNFFDKVEIMGRNADYCGLDSLTLREVPVIDGVVDKNAVIQDFLLRNNGMLLINRYVRVETMRSMALDISLNFTQIPVLLLTSDKGFYLNGVHKTIIGKNISKILDMFNEYPHLIIIANRLSTRGLSYNNSDYSRHITHQFSRCLSITGFLQKCRILGKYNDKPQLTMYLDELFIEKVKKYQKRIRDTDKIIDKYQKNEEDRRDNLLKSYIEL